MFYSNSTLIKTLTMRRNILLQCDTAGNQHIINKINRRLRKLEA